MTDTIAFPPDPTWHNVLDKPVKYHQASPSDKVRAKCGKNIRIDPTSGIYDGDLLSTELCGRCFPNKRKPYETT